jgi:hypothetical protein
LGGVKAGVEGGEEKGKKRGRKRKEEDSLIDENPLVVIPFADASMTTIPFVVECLSKT